MAGYQDTGFVDCADALADLSTAMVEVPVPDRACPDHLVALVYAGLSAEPVYPPEQVVTAAAGFSAAGHLHVSIACLYVPIYRAGRPARPVGQDKQPRRPGSGARPIRRSVAGELMVPFVMPKAAEAIAYTGVYSGIDLIAAAAVMDSPTGLPQPVQLPQPLSETHTSPPIVVPSSGWLMYGIAARYSPGGQGIVKVSMSKEKKDKDRQRSTRYSNAGDADVALAVFDSDGRIADVGPVSRSMTISPPPQEAVTFAVALHPYEPMITPTQPARVATGLQSGSPLW